MASRESIARYEPYDSSWSKPKTYPFLAVNSRSKKLNSKSKLEPIASNSFLKKQLKRSMREKALSDSWFRKSGREPPCFVSLDNACKKWRPSMPLSPPRVIPQRDGTFPSLLELVSGSLFPKAPVLMGNKSSESRKRGLPPVPAWPKPTSNAFPSSTRNSSTPGHEKTDQPKLTDMWEQKLKREDRRVWDQAAETYQETVAFTTPPADKRKKVACLGRLKFPTPAP